MSLKLVSRSSRPAVSLEDTIEHLRRQDTVEDDGLIRRYIAAATLWAENFTGLALVDQTWDYYTDGFPTDLRYITIPKPPLLQVAGVYYREAASSSETTFSDYTVEDAMQPARVYLLSTSSWPLADTSLSSVRIRFRAGYFDAEGSPVEEGDIPEDIKIAIQIYTASLYENRESMVVGTIISQVPWSAENLLRMYRVENSMA
jgi:uncharacterized phiE125 gp8 family phage protein